MSVEKEQQAQKPQNVFGQMPMARADEKFAPAKQEQPKEAQQKIPMLGLKPKRIGELVIKPTDVENSTTAREVVTKTIWGIKDMAAASKHEDVFGTLGLKVKSIEELRVSKDGNSYSAKVDDGKKYLTLRLEKDATSLALSTADGALLAVARQEGKQITFEQQSA